MGGIGGVAALGGLIANFYSPATAIFLALAIWIIGATVVNVIAD